MKSQGQVMVEYALVTAAVVVVMLGSMRLLRSAAGKYYNKVSGALTGFDSGLVP